MRAGNDPSAEIPRFVPLAELEQGYLTLLRETRDALAAFCGTLAAAEAGEFDPSDAADRVRQVFDGADRWDSASEAIGEGLIDGFRAVCRRMVMQDQARGEAMDLARQAIGLVEKTEQLRRRPSPAAHTTEGSEGEQPCPS
jgi:hypothetical protein